MNCLQLSQPPLPHDYTTLYLNTIVEILAQCTYFIYCLPTWCPFSAKIRLIYACNFWAAKRRNRFLASIFMCVCLFSVLWRKSTRKIRFYLELLHQWRSSHHLRYSMTVLSVHWTHAHQKADNFIECYSKCFHWIKCFFFFSIKPTKYCDFCYLNYAFIRASSFLECKSRSIHRGKGMKAAQLSFRSHEPQRNSML